MYGGLGFLYIIWFCVIAVPKAIMYLIIKGIKPELSEEKLNSEASGYATLLVIVPIFIMILVGQSK